VEKRRALVGLTVNVTGAGGAELELQPAKNNAMAAHTTISNEFRFIIYPKGEAEAGASIPVKCEIGQSLAQENASTKR